MSFIKNGFGPGLRGILAVALLLLLCAGGAGAAAAVGPHDGEEMYSRELLRVFFEEGQWQLGFGSREAGLLAPEFTMSHCGQEMAPTVANLQTMVGKPCRFWGLPLKKGRMVLHRLEFQCR